MAMLMGPAIKCYRFRSGRVQGGEQQPSANSPIYIFNYFDALGQHTAPLLKFVRFVKVKVKVKVKAKAKVKVKVKAKAKFKRTKQTK